ncbi:ribosomal protein L22/L17 [Aspergillus karnatakaensis]|uniref:mitochondrial 54S ribosomal protein uL22m n=1 Tax=Aspergillus karnatakaensis TaxID=1810916 RepID=UPI003CCD2124
MATMGALQPYGQLIRSARTGITYVPRRTLTYTPIRRADESNNGPEKKSESEAKPSALSSIKNFFLGGKKKPDTTKGTITRRPMAPMKREGDLGSDSIFAQDEAGPKITASGRTPSARKQEGADGEEQAEVDYSIEKRSKMNMSAVLDPKPKRRVTWERRMVIRQLRKGGRLSKKEQIMQTERESLVKSHWFKTSIKKLGPLARQIAGKNIDDAIVQMQFSKKKAAKDVLEHLKHAKNVAVVRSGMGLGAVGENAPKDKPVTVILKDGEKKVITDRTAIYIDQAWVNRGPYGIDYDYRARGVVNRLRPPYTSLSVVLKEEKTRIREWEDREAKALRQRKSQLWVQLPDRKITTQNQYYSW